MSQTLRTPAPQLDSLLRLTPPAGGRFGQTPPAPLGLRATPGNTQVSLAWNPVAGATGYTLARALSPAGPFQPVATGITALTWVDPGLTNGQTYYYVLSAVGVFGTGPTSNEASATPDGGLPLPVNAAAFVSQGVPASMNAGQQYPVTVTMRNTGTSVWTAAGLYLLGSQADQDNRRWGLGRVALPGTPPGPVQPGATAAFTFTVTAPAAPGSYAFQWRMVQENVQWFGDFTPDVVVTVPAVLTNLTLAPATVTGGGTVAVTLTLNGNAPAGGAQIVLNSSDASVMFPQTYTIPAGQSSATFNVPTGGVSSFTSATVSGSYSGSMQAAILTLLPVDQSYSVQNLDVASGNGCALLFWGDLPEGSIGGYNVYRLDRTTYTLLTASPQQAPFYADTGLTNGATYQYAVSVVDAQGQEHAMSAPVSIVPSSSLGILSWNNPPTTGGDLMFFYASLDSEDAPEYTTLLVDGKQFGVGVPPAITADGVNSGAITGSVEADLDTTELSNGPHTVQLVGWLDENTVCATLPLSIIVSNAISNFTSDDILDIGDVARLDATVAPGTPWTVTVTSEDTGEVVRTWRGASNPPHLAWDGTDSTGAQVPDATYDEEVATYGMGNTAAHTSVAAANAGGGGSTQKRRLYRLRQVPQGLALVDEIATDTSKDKLLTHIIQRSFNQMTSNSGGYFTGKALPAGKGQHMSMKFKLKLLGWLVNNVTDLYIASHGSTTWKHNDTSKTGLQMRFGDCLFFAPQLTHGSKVQVFQGDAKHDWFDMAAIVQGQSYNFVMMDGCNQGGGSPGWPPKGTKGENIDYVGPPNNLWGHVFSIGADPENLGGCFLGWNGVCVTNDTPDWLNWRIDFWDALASNGETVQDAYRNANAGVPVPYQDYATDWTGHQALIEPNGPDRLDGYGYPGQTFLP